MKEELENTSFTKSPSSNRKDLHKEILRRNKSFTIKEQNFLSNVLNEGNEHHITKIKDKLTDYELFFNVEHKDPVPPLLSIDLPPLNKLKLQERALSSSSQKSTELHDKIWKAHEEGISLNALNKKISSKAIATNIRKKKLRRSTSLDYRSKSDQAPDLTKSLAVPPVNPRVHMRRTKSVSFCPTTNAAINSDEAVQKTDATETKREDSKLPFRDSIKDEKGTEERPFITKATPLRRESSIFESESLADELNLSSYFEESRSDDNQKHPWASIVGSRPLLMRESSKGDGVEVSIDTSLDQMRQYDALFASFASKSNSSTSHHRRISTFDELTSATISCIFDKEEDDSERSLLGNMSCVSWDEIDSANNQPLDAWAILKDEYAISKIGYNDTTLPFKILGTSANDVETKPKVLSPPLMDSLMNFLPDGIDANFWLKYSLVRDGASLYTMLQHIRGRYNTILAIETMDGDVFGCYVHTPWKLNHNNSNHFYGDGQAFLWKMRRNRYSNLNNSVEATSILDQAMLESELDVYPWTGKNYMVQVCQHNRIGVGGGATTDDMDGLFGLALEDDLLTGASGPCATFNNPSLAVSNPNGLFEVANLEVWTLTPCATEAEAEKLDFHKLFFSDGIATN